MAKQDTKTMNRAEKIESETKRLKKKYAQADDSLYMRAAVLRIQCEEMEAVLAEQSFTEETINASQRFVKANPIQKEYRETTKAHRDAIKQLQATAKKVEEEDDFEKF